MQAAFDAWSLGVVAFELLTGEQALRPFLGKQEVRRMAAVCMLTMCFSCFRSTVAQVLSCDNTMNAPHACR